MVLANPRYVSCWQEFWHTIGTPLASKRVGLPMVCKTSDINLNTEPYKYTVYDRIFGDFQSCRSNYSSYPGCFFLIWKVITSLRGKAALYSQAWEVLKHIQVGSWYIIVNQTKSLCMLFLFGSCGEGCFTACVVLFSSFLFLLTNREFS